MKYIAIVIILINHLQAFSQSKIFELKANGNSLESLVPDGWRILSSSQGDLNKDGINDLVFVIQNTDKNNFEFNDGLGIDSLDLNPRILGIYFGLENGMYTKKLQSDDFIILQDSPTMDEPFDGVKITDKGILQLEFHFWFSAGSWSMSNSSYKFRFQNKQFELIGYDSNETHRATGETTDYSINFSTRKMNIRSTTFDVQTGEQSDKDEWKEFELQNLKSIQSLGKPFEWKFNGIYI